MKTALVVVLVLLGVWLVLGSETTAAAQERSMPWPTVAEKIRKGEIDVGGNSLKAFGMTDGRRYHAIHSEALGLDCATCHVEKLPQRAEIFTLQPAVDVSPESPGVVDRRVCLGCHVAGPGRNIYGPRTP